MTQLTSFLVIASQARDGVTGNYNQATEVQVWAEDEAQALEKVKVLAPDRALYFVRSIIEMKPEVISEAEKMRLASMDRLTQQVKDMLEDSK